MKFPRFNHVMKNLNRLIPGVLALLAGALR